MNLLTRWFARIEPSSRWFARIRSGLIDAREDKAFIAWLESEKAHAERYEANEMAWGLSLELGDSPTLARLVAETEKELATRKLAPPNRYTPRRLAVAGALVALVAGASAFWFENRVSTADYSTQVGETRVVKLNDGSTVSLNTATEIHVRYSRRSRGVVLVSGEALFNVHPDPKRPFVVRALGGETTAVGTEFAVEVHGTTAAVSVLEGTVSVGASHPPADSVARRITVGQAVDYGPDGTLGETRPADADRIRAWQANRILFADKRLADAIDEYNRYEKTPIVLNAPQLADRRVHGIFRIGDQEAFIHALERALPLRAERTDSAVTLVPK